jgi:hypothetical protein
MSMETPEIGRPKKAGLLGAPGAHGGTSRGTPGPDAGFALTLAKKAVHELVLEPELNAHDVEWGVALLSAKRASLVGRAPCETDVTVVLDLFGFRGTDDEGVRSNRVQRFRGLAHSYFVQRAFVDDVNERALRQMPGEVIPLLHFR